MSHQDLGLESEGTKFGEQLCKAVGWLVTPDAFADTAISLNVQIERLRPRLNFDP